MNLLDKLVAQALKGREEMLPLRTAVEKELLHHDILREMSDVGLLKELTFIGGTCLRAVSVVVNKVVADGGAGAGKVFFFLVRGTGKSTRLKQQYPKAVLVALLAPETFRVFSARPERLREVVRGAETKTIIIDEVQKIGVGSEQDDPGRVENLEAIFDIFDNRMFLGCQRGYYPGENALSESTCFRSGYKRGSLAKPMLTLQ